MSEKYETSEIIDRICEAYGFTSRLQLAVFHGMTASSISNRILRKTFPAELIVHCVLDTKASIEWLVYGTGKMFDKYQSDTVRIPTYSLKESSLFKDGEVMFDKVMLPFYENELAIIIDGDIRYFIDMTDKLTSDGKYLIKYSDTINIRDLTILPGNKIRIDWGKYPIDCTIDDIKISGKVVATYMEHKQ